MTLESAYNNLVENKTWRFGDEQIIIIRYLDELVKQLSEKNLALFKKNYILGVYLWGEVGTGKSALMKLFFDNVMINKKAYWSLASFMQYVHKQLGLYANKANPLQLVAKKLSKQYKLICLDEFEITDISEVMLLAPLLKILLDKKVCLVFTSNTPIHKLYENGLQRNNLLATLALMQNHLSELQLHGIDYRLEQQPIGRYFLKANKCILNERFDFYNQKINSDFDEIITDWPLAPKTMPVIKRNTAIVWVDFLAVCGKPRCIFDYQLLATQLEVIIIDNVPQFLPQQLDLITNFIGLIDALYAYKVCLVMSAEVGVKELCCDGLLAAKFKRTASRLQEMTSLEL